MSLREMMERVPPPPQPWRPSDATRVINRIARDLDASGPGLTASVRVRMEERDLFVPDVLYVLRNGHVYDEAHRGNTDKWKYMYQINSTTPNTGPRKVRCTVVAEPEQQHLILISVMWI